MKIGLIGATGKAGRVFLAEALKKGHHIRALVRRKPDLPDEWPVEWLVGDALDHKVIQKFVPKMDVIVSMVGHSKNSPENLQTHITRLLLLQMKSSKVKRIITLTGYGIPHPKDEFMPHHWLVNTGFRMTHMKAYDDALAHVKLLQRSSMDWTVIRTPIHFDGIEKTTTQVGLINSKTGMFVSRPTIANCFLHCLEDKAFISQMPVVSNWPKIDL